MRRHRFIETGWIDHKSQTVAFLVVCGASLLSSCVKLVSRIGFETLVHIRTMDITEHFGEETSHYVNQHVVHHKSHINVKKVLKLDNPGHNSQQSRITPMPLVVAISRKGTGKEECIRMHLQEHVISLNWFSCHQLVSLTPTSTFLGQATGQVQHDGIRLDCPPPLSMQCHNTLLAS